MHAQDPNSTPKQFCPDGSPCPQLSSCPKSVAKCGKKLCECPKMGWLNTTHDVDW